MLVFVLIIYMFMETCAECRAKHNSEMKDNKEAGIIDKCMLTEEAGILIAGNISLASVIRTFIKNVIKEPKKFVAIMISPLGIFIYMNYLRYFCGDSWAFYHVQRAWRTQKMFPVIGVLFTRRGRPSPVPAGHGGRRPLRSHPPRHRYPAAAGIVPGR